jgi:hypothetical protein
VVPQRAGKQLRGQGRDAVNKRVILGLVLLGAVVSGALVGLLLIEPGDQPPVATPPPARAPAPPPSATPADNAASATAQAIVDAITEGDSHKYGLITCDPQSSADLGKLQRKWDDAGKVSASVVRPPAVTGDQATVTIRVEGAGGRKETEFPLRKKGEKWCVPG